MKFTEGTGKFIMFAAIGVVLLILLWKFVLKKSDEEKERDKDVSTKKKEAKEAAKKVKPSYSEGEYRSLASQLFAAMDGIGTDEDSIRRVFSKMKNSTDLLMLEAAFGERDGYTLREMLQREMSNSDIQTYVNEPLRKNGITA